VAKTCGFTNNQVAPGIVSSNIGDAGASTVLLGLAAILEKVKADERIIVVSYGSGAGSDAASFRIKQTVKKRKNESTLRDYLINKEYIDFLSYLKIKKMINT
jgi:hydroxymethylglutaryl-CoA synthase